ncbi:MAG TPA: hypothetical protein VK427_09360, partial [Kofleriaceae bacterium]|nr:hypothetical protein [Kofleriaceae bacterium]
MSRRLVSAPRAELRLRAAAAWLESRPATEETIVVGATADAASEQIRAIAKVRGAAFGFHRFTLNRLAAELAKLAMVTANLATVGSLAIEALCARVIDRLRSEGKLARLGAVADQPGLPRALARTLDELRMAGVPTLAGELGEALYAIEDELTTKGLADRACVFRIAAQVAESGEPHLLLDRHVLLVDVRVKTSAERRLVAAIVARAPSALATVPVGDERTLACLAPIFGEPAALETDTADALHRVQRRLFAPVVEKAVLDETVHVMSAPGENRECVEIARRVLAEAERGVPFDRMAVLLRSPEQYRVHVE